MMTPSMVVAVATVMAGATDDNQLKAALKETAVEAAARWFSGGDDSGDGGRDGNGDGNGKDDGDGDGDSNSGGNGIGNSDSGGGGGGSGGGGGGRWTVEYTWCASPSRSCSRATGTPSTPSGAGTGKR